MAELANYKGIQVVDGATGDGGQTLTSSLKTLADAAENNQNALTAHTSDASIHYPQSAIAITAAQVSDFDTEVANNPAVAANTAVRHSRIHGLTSAADHSAASAADRGKLVRANATTGAIEFSTIQDSDIPASIARDSELHAPVTVSDSTTVNLTLADQALSAEVVPGAISHSTLGGLNADNHSQYHTDTRAASWLAPQKGTANGLATLGADGKVPTAQLPAIALTDVSVVASQAAQLALTAQEGDVVVRSDLNKSYIHNGGTTGTMTDWQELLVPTDHVLSVNGKTGAVTISTTDIGEGTHLYYTDTRARAAISEAVPGLDYNSATGTLSLTSGYVIPTTTQQNTWSTTATTLSSHTSDASIHYAQSAIAITAAQVSDFDTKVTNNPAVAANTAVRHSRIHSLTSAADHSAASTADRGKLVRANATTGAIEFTTIQDSDIPASIARDTELHAPVTVSDSTTVNLTLAGQALSAEVVPGAISHSTLGDLNADNHSQYHTDTRAASWLAPQKGTANGLATLGADGKVPTAQLPMIERIDDGSAASPSYSFHTDPDTGFYRTGDNKLGVSLGGVNHVTLEPGGLNLGASEVGGTAKNTITLRDCVAPPTAQPADSCQLFYMKDSGRLFAWDSDSLFGGPFGSTAINDPLDAFVLKHFGYFRTNPNDATTPHTFGVHTVPTVVNCTDIVQNYLYGDVMHCFTSNPALGAGVECLDLFKLCTNVDWQTRVVIYGSTHVNQRIFMGLVSGSGFQTSATPAMSYVGFRYDTSLDTNQRWRVVADNGSGTPTVIVTNLPVYNHMDRYRIVTSRDGWVKLYMNHTLAAMLTPATTPVMPSLTASGPRFGFTSWLATSDTAVKRHYFASAAWNHF